MLPNPLVLAACAFIPLVTSYVYFHKNVLGKQWQIAANLTDAQINQPRKWYSWLIEYLLYLLLAMGVFLITVHATHVLAITGPNPDALRTGTGAAFMAEYGENFHTFKHGISHGLVVGLLFFVLPLLSRLVIHEGRSLKYLLLNCGYWAINLVLMACIISKWGGILV